MKKTKFYLTSILVTLLLAACNTSEESNGGQISELDQTDTNGTTIENNTQQDNTNTSPSPEEDKGEEQDAKISYTIGQQTLEKPYDLIQSVQQDFSIPLTDQFYLMEEEPGKDIVVYKDNEAIMMRIEVLSDYNWTYEDALENSISILANFAKDSSYTNFTLPSNINTKSFIQFDSFIVENESDKVVLLLMNLDDKLIRLTIFDDYITNVTDAFLVQGTSIQ